MIRHCNKKFSFASIMLEWFGFKCWWYVTFECSLLNKKSNWNSNIRQWICKFKLFCLELEKNILQKQPYKTRSKEFWYCNFLSLLMKSSPNLIQIQYIINFQPGHSMFNLFRRTKMYSMIYSFQIITY